MFEIVSSGLLLMVVGPALVGLAAWAFGARAPRFAGRLGAATAALGFVGAAALAAQTGGGEPVTAHLGPLTLVADRLAAVLLLLVFGVSTIVQAFAVRYLAGDPRAPWFIAGAGLLTAASAGLMTAGTLVGLAAFWTAAGASLCMLLATYWHLPAARDGVRRTVIAFAIGDLALWTAVILATAAWGRIDLTAARGRIDLTAVHAGQFGPDQYGGALVPVFALLVVVAALSRSAQIPFHRWLPATLAAPTPVSALLHAGVVNAGGILLIRLAPVATDDVARALTVLAGAATIIYGGVIMLVKPDIKGTLVNSTTAQMGFMILTCGLGLWAAAVIHLVAHGFYKATLFLSSGSAIAASRRGQVLPQAQIPTGAQRIAVAATSIALPALALAVGLALVPLAAGDHAAEQALLIFAFVTGMAATWGWLHRRPGIGGALTAAAFLVPAAIAYVAIVAGLNGFLAPALPASTLSVSTVWITAAITLAALGLIAIARRVPAAQRLQRSLYTQALTAGHLTGARA